MMFRHNHKESQPFKLDYSFCTLFLGLLMHTSLSVLFVSVAVREESLFPSMRMEQQFDLEDFLNASKVLLNLTLSYFILFPVKTKKKP